MWGNHHHHKITDRPGAVERAGLTHVEDGDEKQDRTGRRAPAFED